MRKFIGSLLEKYKHLTPPNFYVKKEYRELIQERFNIKVEDKDITVRNNTVYLVAPAILKSELFLNKKKILQELNSKISEKSTRTITDLQ